MCLFCCLFFLHCSGVIALGGTLGYILSFAIGAGPVSGLIVPEINKEAVRGTFVWVFFGGRGGMRVGLSA